MDYADKPRVLLPHGNDVAIPVYDIGARGSDRLSHRP